MAFLKKKRPKWSLLLEEGELGCVGWSSVAYPNSIRYILLLQDTSRLCRSSLSRALFTHSGQSHGWRS